MTEVRESLSQVKKLGNILMSIKKQKFRYGMSVIYLESGL